MKFIISENKINQIILNYLNDNVTPEPSVWGPSFHYKIRRLLDDRNDCTFVIGDDYDDNYFTFYKRYSTEKNVLSISSLLSNNLTSLFNDRWKPIFKEWFEKNTGLEVYHIDTW